jgi:hypothetical protein
MYVGRLITQMKRFDWNSTSIEGAVVVMVVW